MSTTDSSISCERIDDLSFRAAQTARNPPARTNERGTCAGDPSQSVLLGMTLRLHNRHNFVFHIECDDARAMSNRLSIVQQSIHDDRDRVAGSHRMFDSAMNAHFAASLFRRLGPGAKTFAGGEIDHLDFFERKDFRSAKKNGIESQ